MPAGRKEKFHTARDWEDGSVTVLRKGSRPDRQFQKASDKSPNYSLKANQIKSARTRAAGKYAKTMGKIMKDTNGFGYLPKDKD